MIPCTPCTVQKLITDGSRSNRLISFKSQFDSLFVLGWVSFSTNLVASQDLNEMFLSKIPPTLQTHEPKTTITTTAIDRWATNQPSSKITHNTNIQHHGSWTLYVRHRNIFWCWKRERILRSISVGICNVRFGKSIRNHMSQEWI